LAWTKMFLMNNALTVKKDHQHALGVQSDLLHFLRAWRASDFPLTGLLFGFQVVTVNPGLICYDPWREDLVISDFIQKFLGDKHMRWYWSLLRNWGTNFADICHMFKSDIRYHWHVSHERPNLQEPRK
jgi:hypothetical protein